MKATTVSGDPMHPTALQVLGSAAWMAVLLGITVEGAVIIARMAGGTLPKLAQAASEFLTSVTWSTLVCSGIALGSAATHHRDRIMGLMGLVFAPLAWALAKGVQRGTQSIMGAPIDAIGVTALQVGILKTLEYTILGVTVARLTRLSKATLSNHLLLGLFIGVFFGAAIVGVNIWHAPHQSLPAAKILGLSVNEIMFPMGCSAVLYFVARLSVRTDAAEPAPNNANEELDESRD